MIIIVKERYTLNDVMKRRKPQEYAITIIKTVKIAKLNDIHNQFDIIWNNLDVEFQSDIDPFTQQTTLNQLFTFMNVRKIQ